MITINQAPMDTKLIVRSFQGTEESVSSDIESRLMLLGFFDGETVQVRKRAPWFKAPLLVEVRGRMIALSLSEAKLIKVEVSK
jgi:Fe2+ transport system protein FeoA